MREIHYYAIEIRGSHGSGGGARRENKGEGIAAVQDASERDISELST